jgi:pseudouridine synthase
MTRINKFIASRSGISRRSADKLIKEGKILINGYTADIGHQVQNADRITSTDPGFRFDHLGSESTGTTLLTFNKPVGYVCSKKGQGNKTIYDLLPDKYHHLKSIGRLDKDSSGLLLMSNDGDLANKLTHPKYQKEKVYRVKLNKPLVLKDKNKLLTGVILDDGLSKFLKLNRCSAEEVEIVITEGRNRQIRRSFDALGYRTVRLHRVRFGNYHIGKVKSGQYKALDI